MKSKPISIVLGILQLFIGVGAVGGGVGLVMAPDGSNLGLPIEWLKNSPFPDFLIPGIVLMLVNGFGSIAGGVVSFRHGRYTGEIAMGLGVFLMLWIVAQVYWLATMHWLQGLYFIFGLGELILGWIVRSAYQHTSASVYENTTISPGRPS